MKTFLYAACAVMLMNGCTQKEVSYTSFDEYPVPADKNLWLDYNKEATTFKLWSPNAQEVRLKLYEKGHDVQAFETHDLTRNSDGIWYKKLEGDHNGTYYTYQVKANDNWLEETPGIYAQAVGVNGMRAMVLDLDSTDPENWENDIGPALKSPNDAVIYELHIRDMTIHPSSGSTYPGKYLGLVEEGTRGPGNTSTGIDHMKELGITHVHLLPTYDHYSIDESKLDSAQFNWGYDPQNYNVPEGSFSSDPYNAEVRIREFKQMVKAFHDNGIGVILDVVYNHTGRTENSNFNLEAPGYYYRQWEDGSLSDASACGNETASEREMMRHYILESVAYWAEEYHLDGFRFDLMGIHDIETMNLVAERLKDINPEIIIYGEGWSAGDSPLVEAERALKKNTSQMPNIIAFSDDIRDGLKGSVFDDKSTGFVSGAKNTEESVKFGVVGSIQHPDIDYKAVNYSNAPWTMEPWQAISYVSCHDNHTLYDKLVVSRPDADAKTVKAMHKLANAVVLTSQGTAFIHAGVDLLRTKYGEHNSYNLPDSINEIDWNKKVEHNDVFIYYQNLIKLRKERPALRMRKADDVRANLSFKTQEDGLLSYQISNNASGDSWQNVYVIYNSRTEQVDYDKLAGEWKVAVLGDDFNLEKAVDGNLSIPPISMAILYQE